MARLRLSLLGSFQVTLDGEPAAGFDSDKVRALLAYLAVEADRPHRRDRLAGLLWPEWPDRDARNNLRYALSNLRQVLEDRAASPPFLHISRQTIQFNASGDAWVDATALTALLDAPEPAQHEMKEAADLYRGEFLEGFSLPDSVPFEEWMLLKREQLGRRALTALRRLARIHERRGEYSLALPYAYRQIELEPWQEGAHRQLMRLLALNGRRGAALAQYETCRRALAEELDVEPARETMVLYEQIRDGTLGRDRAGEPGAEEARAAPSPQTVEEAPSPPALAPRAPADWRAPGRRLVVGGGILLLAIAAMEAIGLVDAGRDLFDGAPREVPSSLPALHEPADGRILHPCEGVAPPQICAHDIRTGRVAQVTQVLEFETIGRLSWSPDGGQIVFNARSSSATSREDQRLYVLDADGSDLRPITDGSTSDVAPAWSPDGQWIAFNRAGELWLVRPDGSQAHGLFGEPEEACVGDVAWSPDGQQIAFVGLACTPASAPEEIWVVGRDGSGPRVVHAFERPADQTEVLWSADGQEILAVQRHRDEEVALLLIDAAGLGGPGTLDSLPYWWHPTFWPQWGQGE